MKLKTLIVLLSVWLSATIVFAQRTSTDSATASASAVSTPAREDVLRLMDLMRVRQQIDVMMTGMKKQMKSGAEDGFKSKVPNATAKQLAEVDGVIDDMLQVVSTQDMLDAIVPIYQKHLTQDEVKAIIAFYSSPAGQSILDKTPAIMTESMQAGGNLFMQKSEGMSKKLEARIAEIKAENSKPASDTPAK